MTTYRKKPVEISAWRCKSLMDAARKDFWALPKQVIEGYEKGGWVFTDEGIHIPTLEGSMLARPDDVVIQGVAGEFYPCKPEIFDATYEEIVCA